MKQSVDFGTPLAISINLTLNNLKTRSLLTRNLESGDLTPQDILVYCLMDLYAQKNMSLSSGELALWTKKAKRTIKASFQRLRSIGLLETVMQDGKQYVIPKQQHEGTLPNVGKSKGHAPAPGDRALITVPEEWVEAFSKKGKPINRQILVKAERYHQLSCLFESHAPSDVARGAWDRIMGKEYPLNFLASKIDVSGNLPPTLLKRKPTPPPQKFDDVKEMDENARSAFQDELNNFLKE